MTRWVQDGADTMADLREKLDKLRAATADLALMSRRTSDSQKRALFQRLADELAIEALELEQVVKLQSRRASHSDCTHPMGAVLRYGR